MNLPEKIKELRRQFNLSQEQLADKIGVSRQAVTKWETGGGLPDIENMISLSSLFNISLDELISGEKPKNLSDAFTNESVTEYDIDFAKHYDFIIGDAHEIIIQGSDTEKLKVRLTSKVLDKLESNYKVKIDEHRDRVDIDVKNRGVGKAQAREALYFVISLPVQFLAGLEISAAAASLKIHNIEVESLEYDGKVDSVRMGSFRGHLELNCSCNMEVFCDVLNGRVDMNQISAASVIHIPAGTDYFAKAKGSSNKLIFTRDGKATEPAIDEKSDNMIELNGTDSELVIDEYTSLPADASRV